MKLNEVELPSNRKFGVFFTCVFILMAVYLYFAGSKSWTYTLSIVALIFLVITLVKADLFLPLNKLWMKTGQLIGIIISPIVLGIIYFVMFTPVALVMRLNGRDELRLKFNKKPSHWILRSDPVKSEFFNQQF